ncbi:MAG: hypothetical protein K0Q50_581 [Vampirovibrio sp.]|jgi:hypothetical protein|nr:hypothetical protein [Vampirovibrio sp.]
MFKKFIGLTMLSVIAMGTVPAFAGSLVVDGPGFKVEKSQGWFGTKSNSYQDALGNRVEKRTGLFGRTTTHTKVLGNEATVKPGNNVTVTDMDGNQIVRTKRTLFHGRETHVDGNGIFQSLKGLFN